MRISRSKGLIERQKYIKSIGVLLNENLDWKEHIKYAENKITQNLGLLYKARPFLDRNALLVFTYLHQLRQYSPGEVLAVQNSKNYESTKTFNTHYFQ